MVRHLINMLTQPLFGQRPSSDLAVKYQREGGGQNSN